MAGEDKFSVPTHSFCVICRDEMNTVCCSSDPDVNWRPTGLTVFVLLYYCENVM